MKRAGVQVGDQWLSGFVCYGIPVGTSEYVKHQLWEKVQDVKSEVDRVKEVLGEEDSQVIWSIIKCSLAQKLDWHLSLCYPSDISEAAFELDRILWNLLEHATKLHIPKGGEGLGVECVLQVPGIAFLQGRSFQRSLIHQPVKLGGLGLRSLVETSPAAFVGGVEMALPHFTGEEGICSLLEEEVGRIEGLNRWTTFLTANSRTAQEFARSWSTIKQEAEECCTFLGRELEGELAATTVAAGADRTGGSTRRLIVQQREGLRHEVLTLGLQRHADRQARPVTVFQNFDKLSGAWLLALPGPETGLSSKVFSEAMAAHLCLPSPALVSGGWVGKNTVRGGAVIDEFGDAVM